MSLSSLKLIFYQKSFTKEENACQNAFTFFDNIHQLLVCRSLCLYPTTQKPAIQAQAQRMIRRACVILTSSGLQWPLWA